MTYYQRNQRVSYPYQKSNNSQYSTYGLYDSSQAPMSLAENLLTLFLLGIPVAGFILALVWAFSSDTNINKKNLCRAHLIILSIIFGISLAAIIMAIIIGSLVSH